MKILTFGVASSPFQAIYCTQQWAKVFQERFPEAAEVVTNQSYMDDTFGGSETVDATAKLLHETQIIYDHAHMKIHKISGNDKAITAAIDPAFLSDKEVQSILGSIWSTETDQLTFNFTSEKFNPNFGSLKKREALGLIASLFDSLGLISPFALQAKLLMTKLWKLKLNWEDQLPPDLLKEFQTWASEIPDLSQIVIGGWVGCSPLDAYILVSCDVSNVAYGAVAYIWQPGHQAHILFSKTRVRPNIQCL